MKRKIALKRLSSSDLTLFEHHYRNTSGARQKAINLDAAVFVDALFPGLPSRLDMTRDRVIVTLTIYGPGAAGAHSITRKILKQQKNWRLNGELISNPPEELSRYDLLVKGDYAILDFVGELEPHTARMYLVAQGLPQDAALHAALKAKYGASFTPHKGMLEIDPNEFAKMLGDLELASGHPILDFIDIDALEDAAQGGFEGLSKLRKRRQARGVSREELARARQSAEQIGRLGEEILNAWFEVQQKAGSGPEYRWDSDTNAVAPYDFTLISDGKPERRVDAKSTAGDFLNPIHVSMAELAEMAHGELPYDLYRLYTVNDVSARLRIAKDVGEFAAGLLGKFSELPDGVTVDGVSINPAALEFGEEIIIDLSENYGEGNEGGDLNGD
jgi:hypothetical protein